jgi:autotransporter passenger strand-loop-strand repeat protein
MTGSTITGLIETSVTLGASGYASPLTIASRGTVIGNANLGGVYLPRGISHGEIINNGLIEGQAGYYVAPAYDPSAGTFSAAFGIRGGNGVFLEGASATLTNSQYILGGNGYFDLHNAYNGSFEASGGCGVIVKNTATIINSALIEGGAPAEQIGYAGDGIIFLTGGVLNNTGYIEGGQGALNRYHAGNGGVGVNVETGTVMITNNGFIGGGDGGLDSAHQTYSGGNGLVVANDTAVTNHGMIEGGGAAYGGIGVQEYANTKIVNTGTIEGGTGNFSETSGNSVGGGIGLALETISSSAGNSGLIAGGAGETRFYGKNTYGANGGYGVYLHGGTLTNTGTITGGAGGNGYQQAGFGGVGAFLNGGTLITSGTIGGGEAGFYGRTPSGLKSDAVDFGTLAATLVVNPGAVFSGVVLANKAAADVLKLGGSTSKALAGVGTEFQQFKHISFATGAVRTLEGNITGLANGTTIAGFAPHDTIILDGFTALAAADIADKSINLTSGSVTETLDITGNLVKDLIVTGGTAGTTIAAAVPTLAVTLKAHLTELVTSGGTVTATTVNAGGKAIIYKGGASLHAEINKGGTEVVSSGGTASATTISGGTLQIAGGGTLVGTATFAGSGGELTIAGPVMPTAVISGFVAGDKIHLAAVPYSSTDTVTVATAGIVTISAGGKAYALNIAGATKGETDFRFGAGSLLTRVATSATMSFIAPESRPAAGVEWAGIWRFPEFQPMAGASAGGISVPAAAGPESLYRVFAGGVDFAPTLHGIGVIAHF